MNPALANLKRQADRTAAVLAATPTEKQVRGAVADQEAKVQKLEDWDKAAELAAEFGADHPRLDPEKTAAVRAELTELRRDARIAGMRYFQREQAANQAEKAYRREAHQAITSGPRQRAYDDLQVALAAVRTASLELMGSDRAAGAQFDRTSYGPAEALLQLVVDATGFGGAAEALRPEWATPNQTPVRFWPGVAEAEAEVLAWLAKESGE
jgi:hypothetical protein